ncbi:MAG TPA: hypothetical protein QGG30_06140, partial [Acidobacteriota bacterium]|nr:hypothetical protein [Acidobacteriota bacterium]
MRGQFQVLHLGFAFFAVLVIVGCGSSEIDVSSTDASEQLESNQVQKGPRTQPGTQMGLYTPEQHDLY